MRTFLPERSFLLYLLLSMVSPVLGREAFLLPEDQVTATIPVGKGPYDITVSPDSSVVYVANYLSKTVSVIDAKTNTVRFTALVGRLPISLGLTPDGRKLYVHNIYNGTVSHIDTTSNTGNPKTIDLSLFCGFKLTGVQRSFCVLCARLQLALGGDALT